LFSQSFRTKKPMMRPGFLRLASRAGQASWPAFQIGSRRPETLICARHSSGSIISPKVIDNIQRLSTPEMPLYGIFPREREGLDYDLNWALADDDVTPYNDAFRNLELKKLIMRTTGCVDEHKAFHVDVNTTGSTLYFSPGPKTPAPPAGAVELKPKQFRKLLQRVTNSLDESLNVFVQDGAIGSLGKLEVRVRSMSNSPVTTLFLRHMLVPVPLHEPDKFGHKITLYVSPGLKLERPADYGITSEEYIAVNAEEGKVVAVGPIDHEALLSALSYVAGYKAASADVLPVTAHVFASPDGNSSLVFGAPLTSLPSEVVSSLYGAQGAVWTSEGVARSWAGASVADKDLVKKGCLVEHLVKAANKSVRVTFPIPTKQANLLTPPSSVVFLANETTPGTPMIAKLTVSQAKQVFASGYNGAVGSVFSSGTSPAEAAERFGKLLESSKAMAYLLNTNGLEAKQYERLLKEAINGTAVGVDFDSGSEVGKKISSR